MNTRSITTSFLVALWIAIGNPSQLHAQCTIQRETVLPSDPSLYEFGFGYSVGADGDTIVIGDTFSNVAVENGGAAFVYRLIDDEWQQVALLTASDAAPLGYFGKSVAIAGDTIVVGAGALQGTDGAAYVFREIDNLWQEIAKLMPPAGDVAVSFGQTVAIDAAGHRIAVSAPGDETLATEGDAYVFQESAGIWQPAIKLVDPEPTAHHHFGNGIAIDGNTVMVAAASGPYGPLPSGDGQSFGPGKVYVFRESNGDWTFTQLLDRFDGARTASEFGRNIAIRDGIAAAAIMLDILRPCPPDHPSYSGFPGTDCRFGAVYLFQEVSGIWQVQTALYLPDLVPGLNPAFSYQEGFGSSVSISGDTIVVGAASKRFPPQPGETQYIFDGGAAYVFKKLNSEWVSIAKLSPSDIKQFDYFGSTVAVSDGHVVVGGNRPAIIYDLTASPFDCNANGISDDCDIAGQLVRDCNENTIPDDCEPPLGTLSDFIDALLSDSDDPFDVCVFDGDGSGSLNGRDIEAFVAALLDS
ncbi:MAG: hypothetical protein H6819_08700 [Phycisphaerales bacterium]|nr:hypothetical protein [Phycisphaerales bacterium]MCB9855690.1 hypothetical protein [Phycisphaerales bacterium]MCB9862585.1 hypothetical protein [Phycisphaerales bacterium]